MHDERTGFVAKQVSKRVWVTLVTILMVTLSAVTCLAQGDLYAPINAPITIAPSAAHALADLYGDATTKSSQLTPLACLFGHVERDSIVITRVLAVRSGEKCRSSDYIGSVAFDNGSKATETEARVAWMTMCDALQDNVGAYLMAVVYGIVLTKHSGPTPLLWGCYRTAPATAPLHVLK
jgi:hypothetical protein